MLSDKQFNKICSLIKSNMNWDNELEIRDNKDYQRLERKLKELDIVQASDLMKTLEDEKWEVAKLTLNN